MSSPIVILSALGAVSLEGSTLGAVAAGGIIGVAAAYADFVLGAVVLVLCVVNASVHAASDAGVYVIGHVIHAKSLPELISLIVCASGRILFRKFWFIFVSDGYSPARGIQQTL